MRKGAWLNDVSRRVIGAAIEVHRELGPGLLEAVYEQCLCSELRAVGLEHRRQVRVPVVYKGEPLNLGYRVDILVADHIVVEVKTLDHILPLHVAQVLTYVKLAGLPLGLLINFNSPVLKDGIRRLVNDFPE